MTAPLTQRIGHAFRLTLPFLLVLVLVVSSIAPWRLPLPDIAPPAFGLMAVFYWGVYRPEVLPAAAVFLLGLLQDILGAEPLGLNALILLIAYGLMRSQRRFLIGKPFPVIWWGFALLAALAGFAAWLATSAMIGQFLDPSPALLRLVVNTFVFLPVAWIFGWMRRGVLV